MKTGTRWRRAITLSAETWSLCSWVMRMAESDSGAISAAARRRQISRQLRPQSTRTLVRDEATTLALPPLPLARTVMDIATLAG